jgi:hypothetical protein
VSCSEFQLWLKELPEAPQLPPVTTLLSDAPLTSLFNHALHSSRAIVVFICSPAALHSPTH